MRGTSSASAPAAPAPRPPRNVHGGGSLLLLLLRLEASLVGGDGRASRIEGHVARDARHLDKGLRLLPNVPLLGMRCQRVARRVHVRQRRRWPNRIRRRSRCRRGAPGGAIEAARRARGAGPRAVRLDEMGRLGADGGVRGRAGGQRTELAGPGRSRDAAAVAPACPSTFDARRNRRCWRLAREPAQRRADRCRSRRPWQRGRWMAVRATQDLLHEV